nr:MAG TPA: hypothetical protein [Bacteriophage sp.]
MVESYQKKIELAYVMIGKIIQQENIIVQIVL